MQKPFSLGSPYSDTHVSLINYLQDYIRSAIEEKRRPLYAKKIINTGITVKHFPLHASGLELGDSALTF